VDVRIVCATNVDLKDAVEKNLFREDLYYRLNVVDINTPPLRNHPEDIPLLCNRFLEEFKIKYQLEEKRLAPETMAFLMEYVWPGNVRQLKHILERAVILSDGEYIRRADIPIGILAASKNQSMGLLSECEVPRILAASKSQLESNYILEILKDCHWNRTEAAKKIGISRRTLYNKIAKYELEQEPKTSV